MVWAPDYVTTSDLKAFLRIGDTVDDVQLAAAITAASRAIDETTNRQFGKVAAPEARQYSARFDYGRCRWVVDIDDLATVAALVAIVTDVGAISSYELEPVNAIPTGKVWTRLVVKTDSTAQPTGLDNEVAMTASWGWPSVPVAVVQATYLQASRFISRRDSPYGIAGSPDQGSELRLLSRVDPDVAVSLGSYMRRRRVG